MAALSDRIDRLSRTTKSIQAIAAQIGAPSSGDSLAAGTARPFTRAVLGTTLGDLIRDVDVSELGLFSLVESSSTGETRAHERDARGNMHSEITRVEFPGPTPLRKRREDPQKAKELEPEIYAQAALRYLDRYEPIRPMPRAHSQVTSIIEQLSSVRNSMQTLSKTLEQITSADANISVKEQADEQARRVQDLQSRISELNKRKDDASKRKNLGGKFSRPRQQLVSRGSVGGKPSTPISSTKDGDQEAAFWTTPAEAAQTLRFDNLLNDNLVDLGDVSTSFASPIPPIRSVIRQRFGLPKNVETRESPPEPSALQPDVSFPDASSVQLEYEEENQEADEGGEDEDTVVLKKLYTPEPPLSSPPTSPTENSEPLTPTYGVDTPSQSRKLRVKVNSEVERIVARIWTTVGEIIKPGSSLALSGNKPPRAKETILHLQSVSAHTPEPQSPSAASESTFSALPKEPTSQQILTAHLLLMLLSASPHFSMPLNKVKVELVNKAGGNSPALSMGTTRILYGCVAKKLVKIDRGGGEQIVKFDV